MHSMTTNDEIFYDKYEKYDMKGIKISTNRSNLGVIGSHSNWGKNWSMKRKTSIMIFTKPLRWVRGIPWRENRH